MSEEPARRGRKPPVRVQDSGPRFRQSVAIRCEEKPNEKILPVPSHHGEDCRQQHSHAHPPTGPDDEPEGICCEGRLSATWRRVQLAGKGK